jgi:hypothetical protein
MQKSEYSATKCCTLVSAFFLRYQIIPKGLFVQRLLSCKLRQFCFQHTDRLYTSGSELQLSILKNDGGGHGANGKFLTDFFVSINIDFNQAEVVTQVGLKLSQNGAVRMTGATPSGKKVD